jgi:hypothetical protein
VLNGTRSTALTHLCVVAASHVQNGAWDRGLGSENAAP